MVTLCVSVAVKVWHWIGRVLSDNAKVSSSFMQQRRNGVLKNWMLLIPPPPPHTLIVGDPLPNTYWNSDSADKAITCANCGSTSLCLLPSPPCAGVLHH